jgi:opacity protein-like surface antigen
LKKLSTAALAMAALAAPASASADNIRQKGGIVGDDKAKISLKVETRDDGSPKAIVDYAAENIATRCEGKSSRIDFTVLDPVPVKDDGGFKVRLRNGEGGVLRISGKVEKGNERVVGNLKSNEFETSTGDTCKTPKQRWNTSA